MTEWHEIVQGSLEGLEGYPKNRTMGLTARFPKGTGCVYQINGSGLWYGTYEPEGGGHVVSDPLWRRSEAILWCERMAGVGPVALGLGI